MKKLLFTVLALFTVFVNIANAQSTSVFHLKVKDIQVKVTHFASLPATGPTQAGDDTGSRFYFCDDCKVQTTCAGSGTGAYAWWNVNASSWACAGSLPSNLLTTSSTFGGDLSGTSGAAVVQGFRGVAIKAGAPANNQAYVYVASNSDFELTTVSIPATGLQSGRVVLGGNTTVTTSQTTLITQGLTMPATGCPCRIQTQYAIYGTANAALVLSGNVTDGTNVWGTSAQTFANAATGAINGSDTSTVTYANNASVTITLRGVASTGTFTAKPGTATAGQTYLSYLVIGSS